jgi:potassium efflux system protein
MDCIDLGSPPNNPDNPGNLNPRILWPPVFNGQVVPQLLKSIALGCLLSLLAHTHLLAQNNPPNSSSQATQHVPTADQPSGPTTRRNTVRALMASRQAPANSQEPASKEPSQKDSQTTDTPAVNSTNPDLSAISLDAVTAQLQQILSATDLDANLKQTLTTTYEAVLAETKKRIEEEKAIKDYQAALDAASVATTDAKRRKEKPDFKSVYFDGSLVWSNLDRLQAYQLDANAMLQAAAKNRTETETKIAAREARKKELPRFINDDKSSIAKLNEELAAPVPEGTDPKIREANQLLIRAKLATTSAHLRRVELEQRTYESENELLPLRKDLYLAEEKFYQGQVKEITEELGKRRETQIGKYSDLVERLRKQLKITDRIKDPKEFSDLKTQIVSWRELVSEQALNRSRLEDARNRLRYLTDRYRTMVERLGNTTTVESNPSNQTGQSSLNLSRMKSLVANVLKKQREDLPKIDQLNRELEDCQSKIILVQSRILALDDLKRSFEDSEIQTATAAEYELLVSKYESVSEDPKSLSEDQKRTLLLATEQRIIDEFRIDANNAAETLFNLAVVYQGLIEHVTKYRKFIDEHILWIRSTDPFGLADWQAVADQIKRFFDLSRWREVPLRILEDFRNHTWGYFTAILSVLLLAIYTKKMRQHITKCGVLASKSTTTSFMPTFQTILLCLLLALPLVIIHLLLGWRLLSIAHEEQFVAALGWGLLVSARYFFPLEVLRQIARSGGLAENHFQWSKHSTSVLRSQLRWLIDLAIPCVGLYAIVVNATELRAEESLGRVLFGTMLFICTVFLINTLHPRYGVLREYLQANSGGWIDRLRFIWYIGLCIAPIVLLGMSLMGYHYTATRLAMHLHTSFMTLVGLLLIYCIICRWLLLRKRTLIVQQARQRLEEARRRDADGSLPPAASTTSLPIELTDLSHINAQTMRLVSSTLLFAAIAAIAFIWSSVLPAVGALDSVKLWSVTGATPDEKLPVTLANLLLAIPAAIMTIVAAKNLPGLLEIALLQHLPLENAVRYAITSISRYTILMLGIAMTFNSLGVRWASIQWLVAALGVGLGFGLQEIFANFISGLILLFEQPIRVGDVITVGDTTGTVSKIRMRATTVMNFDQQELVIPNKDLVTGRLLNWTLSDSTNRMIIDVGVAYGTDTTQACQILREICLNHPNVLKTPEPTAFFEIIGDSTLQLKVRLFLASLDLRLPTRHDLLTSIHQRFAQEKIEMAYPTRELHIKSIPKEWPLSAFKAPTSS